MDEHINADPTPMMSASNIVQAVEEPQVLLERALVAHLEYRYDEAEALYQKALALDPGLLSGRVRYAILLAQRGRPGEAQAELERAFAVDLSLTVARLQIARDREPGDDAILSLWGLLEMCRGNRASAREWLDQALRFNQKNAGALAWKAQILADEEDYADAEDYLTRAQELTPEDAAVKAAEKAIARGKEALRQAEFKAARLRDQLRQHLAEADRLMAHEDYAGATAELEAAQQLLPGDEEIRERLETVVEKRRIQQLVTRYQEEAQQKAQDGDLKGAIVEMEKALSLQPDSASVREAYQRLVNQVPPTPLKSELPVTVPPASAPPGPPPPELAPPVPPPPEQAPAVPPPPEPEPPVPPPPEPESPVPPPSKPAPPKPAPTRPALSRQPPAKPAQPKLSPVEPTPPGPTPAAPVPSESLPPGPPPAATPDDAIRHYARQAVTAWLADNLPECLEAAQRGYELVGKATDAQALGLGLQCGLVWVGLTWTSSLTLSSAKKKTLLEAAERIGSDKTHAPLRAKFYTHLLPHLTMAMLINDDYPLVNLGPNVSDKERDLLERKVQKYASLTDQDCQALHDVLKAQAAGDEMGMLVVHTITELLRRRK